MLSATVTVQLSADGDDHSDRVVLQDLPQIPDGARLVVRVGDRQMLSHSAVSWLAEHARRLSIEIDAVTPQAARRWYTAIKNGSVQ